MNTIHPSVIIGDDVILGDNNIIEPFTILKGPLKIGDNNIISSHVVIGSLGQDTKNPRYDGTNKFVEIGNNNIIREFSAIKKPCYKDITKIGNNIYLMQNIQISHDAIIEDDVVITAMCAVAGISTIMRGAYLGMGVTVSQYSVVGSYSIIATGAPVVKNVKPFSRYIPNKNISVNTYAIKKYGFDEYTQEITDYVLNNKQPKSKRISEIILDFDEKHKLSKKSLY